MSYYNGQVRNVKTRKEDIWKCLHFHLQTEELLCFRVVGLLHIQKHTTSNTQSESVFDSGHTQAFCLNE